MTIALIFNTFGLVGLGFRDKATNWKIKNALKKFWLLKYTNQTNFKVYFQMVSKLLELLITIYKT